MIFPLDQNMHYEINLNEVSFFGYHGVLEAERDLGNEFKVNLSVTLPFQTGIIEDDLSATVSYADLFEIVSEEMKKPRKLLEKLAYEIGRRIKEEYPLIEKGFVRIEKVRPPIKGMLGSASVEFFF